MIGATIGGRYELIRLLGVGGMGSVYEARHASTGRKVAVKVIALGGPDPEGQAARLDIEARAAGSIESEHVAEVLDAGSDPGRGVWFIVLECLGGEDLHDLLGRVGALAPGAALRIAAQACRGLGRAHEAGIVHRDIKPANLFLARREAGERVVKILDFGIAKMHPAGPLPEGRARVTRTGSMLGSPLYMSPEQARGRATLDHRTDLWSLGVVLYEALAGRTPHPGEAPIGELIVSICKTPAPPIRAFAPWVPEEIARIVERALAIEPGARYQTAAEMLGDLAALLPEGTALREEALAPADAPVTRRPAVAPTLEVGAPSTRGPAEGNSVPPAPLDETRAASERAAASGPRLGHLPAPLTSFIGRAREIEEVRRLLGGGARLLTLVGPGGTGKTRLALRVAAELRGGLEHGAGFVDLSPLTDPAAVPQAIAAVLGAREEPGLPLEVTIARQLRAREILLVIDNCEHLIAGCAQLAERLLGACPRLRILATSREALSVDGETVFAVAPLSVPASSQGVTAEVALRSEAVRLFVERARAALPGFELRDEGAPAVVHVCQRLDGIPLAIELAAARVRAMSVEQIATRIRDRFGLLGGGRRTTARRQQTLRGLIDWSHDLLGAPERAMLRRASVFHGGFSLEAAEAVCAWPGDPAGVEPASVLDLVVQLASKSLVVADPEAGAGRYRLLETIRHYGWEKLQAAGEEGIVRERHLDFFRRLAEDAEPALRSGAQLTWLERLDAEHDNLRIALDFCQEPARREPGLRLAGALGRFWWLRGHHLEGCAWLERLLDRSAAGPAPATAEARAKALGQLALLLPSASQARPWWAESLAAYREAGDAWGIALSLLSAAEWELHEGDHGAARALLEEGLGRARATGDPWILAGILDQLGRYHRGRLELAEAVRRLEEGVALARATADRWLIGLVLLSLGLTRSFQGDHAPARALLEESLALQRSLGSKAGIAETLKCLGGALECLGEHGKAAACYEETLELARGLGSEALVAAAHLNLAHNALAVGAVAEVRRCLREAFLRWPEIARKDQVAWSLLVLGELARREGQPAQAARFFGAEQSLEETFGLGLHPPSRAGFEQILEALRAELGERAEAAWSEGRAMPLEEVLRSAVAYLTA